MKTVVSKELPPHATVTARRAVDVLCNVSAVRKLDPFMRAEQTLSTAAASLGVNTSTLAYWVPRFLAAGLLRVVRTEARAGMATTWYRATAASYFVPMAALGERARQQFVDDARSRTHARFLEAARHAEEKMESAGLTFGQHPESGITISYEPPAQDLVGLYEMYGAADLTDDEVTDVQQRLTALSDLLMNATIRPGTSRHLFQFGFVPAGDTGSLVPNRPKRRSR